MKEAGKKSRVIEVYSLIFIDLLCTGVAFGLSAFLRQVYDVNGPLDRRSSLLGCVLSLLCCCLYNILVDGNRGFLQTWQIQRICCGSKMYCDGHDYSTCDHVLPS